MWMSAFGEGGRYRRPLRPPTTSRPPPHVGAWPSRLRPTAARMLASHDLASPPSRCRQREPTADRTRARPRCRASADSCARRGWVASAGIESVTRAADTPARTPDESACARPSPPTAGPPYSVDPIKRGPGCRTRSPERNRGSLPNHGSLVLGYAELVYGTRLPNPVAGLRRADQFGVVPCSTKRASETGVPRSGVLEPRVPIARACGIRLAGAGWSRGLAGCAPLVVVWAKHLSPPRSVIVEGPGVASLVVRCVLSPRPPISGEQGQVSMPAVPCPAVNHSAGLQAGGQRRQARARCLMREVSSWTWS